MSQEADSVRSGTGSDRSDQAMQSISQSLSQPDNISAGASSKGTGSPSKSLSSSTSTSAENVTNALEMKVCIDIICVFFFCKFIYHPVTWSPDKLT